MRQGGLRQRGPRFRGPRCRQLVQLRARLRLRAHICVTSRLYAHWAAQRRAHLPPIGQPEAATATVATAIAPKRATRWCRLGRERGQALGTALSPNRVV